MPRTYSRKTYIKALAWYFEETEAEAVKELGLFIEIGGDNLVALDEIAHIYTTQTRI